METLCTAIRPQVPKVANLEIKPVIDRPAWCAYRTYRHSSDDSHHDALPLRPRRGNEVDQGRGPHRAEHQTEYGRTK